MSPVEPAFPERKLKSYGLVTFAIFTVIMAGFWYWMRHLSPYAILDPEYSMWTAKRDLAAADCSGKILILGDSTAVADLIPARIDPRVVNLAVGGGTSIEMYFTAALALSKDSRPLAVILSITPLRLMKNAIFWERTAKFDYLGPYQFAEVCARARSYGDQDIVSPPSFLQIDERLKEFLMPRKFPSFFFTSLRDSHFGKRGQTNRQMYEDVRQSRGYHWFGKAERTLAPDDGTLVSDFTPTRLLDEYLESTLTLLESKGVPVYFIASPCNEISLRAYKPAFVSGYENYLQSIAKKHSGFHIIGPLLRSLTPDWFGDASHLNPAGAERWSEIVCRMLNEVNASGAPFIPETRLLESRSAQSSGQ